MFFLFFDMVASHGPTWPKAIIYMFLYIYIYIYIRIYREREMKASETKPTSFALTQKSFYVGPTLDFGK